MPINTQTSTTTPTIPNNYGPFSFPVATGPQGPRGLPGMDGVSLMDPASGNLVLDTVWVLVEKGCKLRHEGQLFFIDFPNYDTVCDISMGGVVSKALAKIVRTSPLFEGRNPLEALMEEDDGTSPDV